MHTLKLEIMKLKTCKWCYYQIKEGDFKDHQLCRQKIKKYRSSEKIGANINPTYIDKYGGTNIPVSKQEEIRKAYQEFTKLLGIN